MWKRNICRPSCESSKPPRPCTLEYELILLVVQSRVAEDSLFKVFIASAVIAAYGFIALFFIRWKKIAKDAKKPAEEKASDVESA